MPKFKVGGRVLFESLVDGVVHGRILAITATEYAVAVPGEGVVWILKREAVAL